MGEKCVLGFPSGSPRNETSLIFQFPAFLGKKALKKYFESIEGTSVYAVRKATATVSFTYETAVPRKKLSNPEDVSSELRDSKDGALDSFREEIIGYKCGRKHCDDCPLLIDEGVYNLLRGKK